MSQAIEDIQETIRSATADHTPFNIKGRGTWTSAYRHPSAAHDLSLWNYAGVQEYVPGNLTMTVRAGTTLREISEIAGAENQWLPLDPFGDAEGTIGATIATCSHGPLVTGFGTPRDLVLGVEAVLGSGEIVRGGGRVVKNVAGYDLSRLFTGSWGTIGAVSEVSLRLFAKQEAESSVAIALPEKRQAASALIGSIRASAIFPWAMEIIDPTLAAALDLPEAAYLAMRFGGNRNVVSSQVQTVSALGNAISLPNNFWKDMTAMPHGWSLRISGLPARLFDTWDAAGRLVTDAGSGFRTVAPERGVARVFFPSDIDSEHLFTSLGQFAANTQSSGLRIIVEAMPSVSPLTNFLTDREVANGLSAGIKRIFDPNNILNPGLLPQ